MNKFKSFSRELCIRVNSDGIIENVSENIYNILGYFQHEVVGFKISNFLNYSFSKLVSNTENEITIQNKDNTKLIFDINCFSYKNADDSIIYYFSLFNINNHKEIYKKYKEVHNIINRSKDIIYKIELYPQFKFNYISPAIEYVLGVTPDEVFKEPKSTILSKVHPQDKLTLLKRLSSKFDFSKPIHTRFKNKNGHYVWLEDFILPIYNNENKLIGMEGFCRNIHERKLLEENLKKLSRLDGPTRLFNKSYFQEKVKLYTSKINTSIGIIFLDLDNLKYINDNYGHFAGDIIIKNTSLILKQSLKKKCMLFRIGGDEFVIMCIQTPKIEFEKIYQSLIYDFKRYNSLPNEFPIHVSMGHAFSLNSKNNVKKIIDLADKKMYLEKQKKKIL